MKAKKSFGQHFLTQEPIAERLADALNTAGCDTVVEIGPGKGILTKYLLKQSLPVVAIELDRDLIPFLEREFSHTSLRIVQGDVLRCGLMKSWIGTATLYWWETFHTIFQARLFFLEFNIDIRFPLWQVCFSAKWLIVFVLHPEASSMV